MGIRLARVLVALLVLSAPLAGQGDARVMRGQVLERGSDRPVAQATVTVGDSARAITDGQGRFEIRGIRPGRYGFTVEALGYRTVLTVVTVIGDEDVSATVHLDPEPIVLDSLAVRPRRIAIRGRVVAKGSGESVPELIVRAGEAGSTATNTTGGFRLPGLYAGTHVLSVEGFGWTPRTIIIETTTDTVVHIEVERDMIMGRIIEQQITRLHDRAKGTGRSVVAVARESILRSRAATPVDVLVGEAGLRVVDCGPAPQRPMCIDHPRRGVIQPQVFIDEVPQMCGMLLLRSYQNGTIERLEVLDDGAMIRAYTRRFIEWMNARQLMLAPIRDYERVFQC
jgi:hypothetical protein